MPMPSTIGIFNDCLCPTYLPQVEKLLRTGKTAVRDLIGLFGISVALVFRKLGEPPARRLQ